MPLSLSCSRACHALQYNVSIHILCTRCCVHWISSEWTNTIAIYESALLSFFKVAMLGGADEPLSELAYQYGRNVGLAFQLVDDLLDFVSSADAMGKPTAADLKLGLATAPVLFACEKVCVLGLLGFSHVWFGLQRCIFDWMSHQEDISRWTSHESSLFVAT